VNEKVRVREKVEFYVPLDT